MQAAKNMLSDRNENFRYLPQRRRLTAQADETDAFLLEASDKRANSASARRANKWGLLNRPYKRLVLDKSHNGELDGTFLDRIALVSFPLDPRDDLYLPYRRQAQGSVRITNQIHGSRRS